MRIVQKVLDQIWPGWQVECVLGQGPYGTVYRISRTDESGHRFTSALKKISIPQNRNDVDKALAEGLSREEAEAYYRRIVDDVSREIKMMADLKGNPNIVSYQDYAVVKEKTHILWDIYIRMELLKPLEQKMESGTFDRNNVIDLGIDICKALEACRKYHGIHGDIKPSNILVSERGEYKLGDFGIARRLARSVPGMSVNGTEDYMAPEVLKGESCDTTADIYSLGKVLHHFLEDNGESFPKNAEDRLGEIILKACAYEPGSRYQDPSDLRKDLEKVRIAGSEIERKPDTAVDRPSDSKPEPVSEPGSKMNGHPGLLILGLACASALFLALAFGFLFGMSDGRGTRMERTVATTAEATTSFQQAATTEAPEAVTPTEKEKHLSIKNKRWKMQSLLKTFEFENKEDGNNYLNITIENDEVLAGWANDQSGDPDKAKIVLYGKKRGTSKLTIRNWKTEEEETVTVIVEPKKKNKYLSVENDKIEISKKYPFSVRNKTPEITTVSWYAPSNGLKLEWAGKSDSLGNMTLYVSPGNLKPGEKGFFILKNEDKKESVYVEVTIKE